MSTAYAWYQCSLSGHLAQGIMKLMVTRLDAYLFVVGRSLITAAAPVTATTPAVTSATSITCANIRQVQFCFQFYVISV